MPKKHNPNNASLNSKHSQDGTSLRSSSEINEENDSQHSQSNTSLRSSSEINEENDSQHSQSNASLRNSSEINKELFTTQSQGWETDSSRSGWQQGQKGFMRDHIPPIYNHDENFNLIDNPLYFKVYDQEDSLGTSITYRIHENTGSKYKGVNHDRIALCESTLGEDTLKAHLTVLEKMNKAVNKTPLTPLGQRTCSGSTVTLVTHKDNIFTATYLGDSPAWVMEIKPDRTVKAHLLHGHFDKHCPDALNQNEIAHSLGKYNDNKRSIGTASVEEAVKAAGKDTSIFQKQIELVKEAEEGSQFLILAGSDGLLDHIGINWPTQV